MLSDGLIPCKPPELP